MIEPRFGRPRLPTPLRLALLPLGIAWALGAEWVRLAAHFSWTWILADLLPGLAFLVLGQIAWARRPDNRIGPLMVATGFAWFVGTYTSAFEPRAAAAAYAFQGYYDALLAWLVLAYPSGRLDWRASQLVVAAFFATLAARTVFRFAVFRHVQSYDFTVPEEVDRYVANETLRANGELAFNVAIVGLAVAVLVLVLARVRTESATGRRIAGPILLGGIALALGIVVEFASSFVEPATFEQRGFLLDFGQYLTGATLALVPVGFAYGLVRSRLARGSVADLVLELEGAPPGAGRLRDVLASALRDPSLEVAYALPGGGGFVDAAGHAVTLPDGRSDRAVTRLERDGRTVAALVHDPALSEEVELVRSVAAATRLALENEQLQAEVQAQLEEVRASRARIVEAGDAERRRVERDLHDGAQQRLVTLALALQMSQAQAGTADPALVDLLSRASRELDLALRELRELARGIHPAILAEAGLGPAIEALADRSPVPVSVSVVEGRFDTGVEATAYFVVAEALTNVAKYAAASKVIVDVERRNGTLHVRIRDDGAGGADAARGSGLRGLADRVAAVDGVLRIDGPAGGGTTITAEIPCA